MKPSQSNAINQQLKQALECHQTGNLAAAEEGYRNVIRTEKNSQIALQFLSEICIQSQRQSEGQALIDRLASQKEVNAEFWLGQIKAQLKVKEFETAQMHLDAYTRIFQQDANAYYLQGLSYSAETKLESAVEKFSMALIIDPNHADALRHRANAYCELNRFDAALIDLNRALLKDSDALELYLKRASVYLKLQNPTEASKDFLKAIELEPKSYAAYIGLGQLFAEEKLHKQAIKAFKLAMLADPAKHQTLSCIIRSLHLICDWSDYEKNNQYIIQLVSSGSTFENPFSYLNITSSAAEQLACANYTSANEFRRLPRPQHAQLSENKKIKIGYVSGDYYNHATTILIEKLFH